MFDLDVCKDEVRLVPTHEFEVVQLEDNLARSVKIGYELSFEVKSPLIECLQGNTNIFSISPYERPNIDPAVVCHQLNIDPDARYVSQQRRK